MKILKNPIFVGVLVVVALVIMFRNFNIASLFRKPPSSKTNTAAAAAEEEQAADENAGLTAGVDPERVGWGSEQPRRNPFRSTPDAAEAEAENPEQTLVLAATWLQDTGRLAIINGGIVAEGETVDGMRIESIFEDRVIVSGPRGPAAIGFRASSIPRSVSVNAEPAL
jgi:hypothetical protein